MGDELIKSVGIGNLSRVLAHGEELGVKRVKPQESGKPEDEGVRYEIPSDPPVPGKRIYDDAIMRFEKSRPKGEEDANRIAERRKQACKTAERFRKGGLDAFVDDLAKGMGVKADDQYSRAAMTRIAEQLFASKAVTWWARNVLQEEAKAVVVVDLAVGRGITRDRLLDAAATLTVMVRRGELDLEHVETYLNETVYDYADKKTVVQMTARAMGEMRANVLDFGWGKRYADLVKRYSQAVNVASDVKLKFDALCAKAAAIREARRGLVQELGLDGVMIKPDDDAGTVLSAFRTRLKRAGAALEQSRHSYGASGPLDGDRNFAGAEVREFLDAAKELEALLGAEQKQDALNGWTLVDEFADTEAKTAFTTSFRDMVADGVKLLDQGLELTARLEREEEIRAAFKEAISGIETGENGLCQPGVYQLSIAVDVGTGFGLGVEGAKASVKGKLGVQVTVAIGEDGSASVAHGFSAGLEIGAEVKIPAVKVKGCVDASAAIKNATNYKSIDDMCNGMSRAVLAIATGKELGNIFHAGSANAKSMAMSRRLDNYAMRAHLGNLGLLDDTDRYLTPLRNDKVAGETKSGTFKGGAKLSVSAGSDEDTFLKKSGFNANFSGSLGATLSTTIKYRTHFDVARDEKPEDLKPPLSLDEILARETQIKNRLVELRAELEDFTCAAAAQSGGSKSQYARPNKSYRQHLANRSIVLKGWNAFRNIFQGNIRRTLFLADLARDAANCEAQLRSLQAMKPAAAQPGAASEPVVLPEDAEHTIRMIEEGIYGRCGVRLNEAVAKNCLYVTDAKRKVAVSHSTAAGAGFVIPGTATAPGLSASVTFGFAYDPEHPNLEPRPWDTRGSTSIAIGFTDMPGADAIVDLVMSKLDELMPVNDLLAFGGREFVAKQVNDFLAEHAKDWVPPSGLLSDKIAHTLTFNIVRTGTGLRLGDISLSRSHIQSISANTPDLLVSASLSLSRTSDKVLRCSLGTNTLNGLMSRYERYGNNPVLWESLLQQQGENVAELAKNMSAPPDGRPPVKPRAGVAGELDMILQQMIRNGNRTSLEAFVKAWAEVKAVADGGNAKSCGAALTKLFKAISAFYEDEDWRKEHEMPVEGQAKTVQKKPAEDKSPADQLDNLQQAGKTLVESSAERRDERVIAKVSQLLGDAGRFPNLGVDEKKYLLDCLRADLGRFIDDLRRNDKEKRAWDKDSFINGGTQEEEMLVNCLNRYLESYRNISDKFPLANYSHAGKGGPGKPDDVKLGTVWGQGLNTCFMMSVLNGLVQTQKGVDHLKRHFDGTKFKVSLPKKAGQGENQPFEREVDLSPNQIVQSGFSPFEEKLYGVYSDYLKEEHPGDVNDQKLGKQGLAPRFAEVLGLVPDGTEVIYEYGGDKKDVMARRVAGTVNDALRAGKMCVLFAGKDGSGHYMAITGVRIDENGLPKFRILDSARGNANPDERSERVREVYVSDFLGVDKNHIDILEIPAAPAQ